MPAPPINREQYYADLGWKPREWQRKLDWATDEAGYRFVSGFAFPRAGKSAWVAKNVGPRLLLPGHQVGIVAPTYELGSKEFLYIFDDLLQLGFLSMSGVEKHRDVRGNMRIRFPWGAMLKVLSAEHPTSLRGEEWDDLILAEASGLSELVYFHHLFIRVEKRKGRVLVPTTPKGRNWVYEDFRIPSLKTLYGEPNPLYNPEFFSLVISADPELVDPDNPELADMVETSVYDMSSVELGRAQMPRPVFIEQFGGGFAAYAGQVFPYDPRIHRVPANTKIEDHWTHVVGWDHGAGPSITAILVFSYDERGHSYWWGHIRGEGQTAAEYLQQLRALLGPNKRLSAVGVDPSAKQVRIELGHLGLATTISFDKSEAAGILRLNRMLGEGSMHILEGACKDFETDLLNFQYDDKTLGKTKDSKHFHWIAAARYGSLIELPKTEHMLVLPGVTDPLTEAMWKPLEDMRKRELAAGLSIDDSDDLWGDYLQNEDYDPNTVEDFF